MFGQNTPPPAKAMATQRNAQLGRAVSRSQAAKI
jgi:hypothetical protein